MTESNARIDTLVQHTAQLIEAGQKDAARQLLAEALALDSQRVDAWVLLAQVTYSTAEEIDCLKRIVALDPNQLWAKQRLDELGSRPTTATPETSSSSAIPRMPKTAPTVVGVAARAQKRASTSESTRKRSRRIISPWWLLIGLVGLACGAVWVIVLIRPLRELAFGAATPMLATQAGSANSAAACQRLIEQALQVSTRSCSQVGPNQVCYGNNSLQATFADNSNDPFTQEGDIVDAFSLKELSASPLNLANNEWGIGIFKLLANLPRTAPGENVTFVVFGNTTLTSADRGLEAFYFSSGAGRVTCDQVPMDGITVNMPQGGGVRFVVNGAAVTLLGNAALEAHPNESMTVSVLSGSALVSADGVDRYFGAGQQVGVPLGGANGVVASGPPSEPSPLAPAAQQAACTLTGTACNPNDIQTVSPAEAQAAVQQAVEPIPTTLTLLPRTPTRTATTKAATPATPGFTPTATGTRPATRTPTPNGSPTSQGTSSRTPSASPTVTPSLTGLATSNGTFTATATATRTATNSSTSATTSTPTFTPTRTLTRTATPTSTASSVFTVTSTPTLTSPPATATFTATTAPTNTPTPTATPTATNTTAPPTATTAPCNISGGGLSASGTDLSISVQNNMSTTVTIASVSVTWIETPSSQKLRWILVGAIQVWMGPDNNSPSDIPSEGAWSGLVSDRQIGAGASQSITFIFMNTLQASGYSLTLNFDNGCTLSANN